MLNVSGSMSTSTGVAPSRDDAAGGGEERIGAGHDLVARADAERHQRREQRVGARRHADRVVHAEVRLELALEPFDLGPVDEALAVADAGDGVEELRREAGRTAP